MWLTTVAWPFRVPVTGLTRVCDDAHSLYERQALYLVRFAKRPGTEYGRARLRGRPSRYAMAGANFGLTAIAGAPPSPGFKFQGYEKSTTDKAQIIEQLNRSFDYAEKSISNMSDADLLKPLKFQEFTSVGDIVFHIVAHAHEHLGQSIAYARMNGVVPPWTAAAQQQRQARPPQ